MKTVLKIAAALFLFFVLMRMCSDGEPASASYDTDTPGDTTSVTQISLHDVKELLEKDRKLLEDAKKNFDFKEDEFTGGGWYKHKLWDVNKIYNKTLLTANVHKSGLAYLVSNYYGDDWLFHESITVKIDERVMTSETVPSFDKSNMKENSGGSVWETIHFTDNRDSGILSAIGANPEKVIKVRLNGRQYNKDYTLSKNDKQAIADCTFLAQLIKSVNEKEEQLKSAGEAI